MPNLLVVISNQYDPFLNRAVEQYLTDKQEEDTVTLYLWKNQQTVVIGYNQKTHEILYTDSWGAGHELKRMPAEWAWTISHCLMYIKPLR